MIGHNVSPSLRILFASLGMEKTLVRRWITAVFLADAMTGFFRCLQEDAQPGPSSAALLFEEGLQFSEGDVLRLRGEVEKAGMPDPSPGDLAIFEFLLRRAGMLLHEAIQRYPDVVSLWNERIIRKELPPESCVTRTVLPIADLLIRSSHPRAIIDALAPEYLEEVLFIFRESLNVADHVAVDPQRLFLLCRLCAGSHPDPLRRQSMVLSMIRVHFRHGRYRNALDAACEAGMIGPLWDPDLAPVIF